MRRLLLFSMNVFIASVLCWCAPSMVSAEGVPPAEEVSASNRTRIGIRGGILLTDVYHLDAMPAGASFEPISGWQVGLDLRGPTRKSVSLETGILVVQKGVRENRVGPIDILGFTLDTNLSSKTELTYLVVPVRIKTASRPNGNGPYVRAGADLGFLLRAMTHLTGTIAGNVGTAVLDQEESSRGDFREIDVSFALDFGVQVPFGKSRLYCEVGGTLGLASVASDSEKAPSRNRTIGIVLGVEL